MKTLWRKTLIPALLSVSLTAQAKSPEEFCEALADIGYSVAIERDRGTSQREMRHRAIKGDNEDIRDVVLIIIKAVYERPWDTPDKEASMIKRDCDFVMVKGSRT